MAVDLAGADLSRRMLPVNMVDEPRQRQTDCEEDCRRRYRRGAPTPSDDHCADDWSESDGDARTGAKNPERKTALFAERFGDQHADRHEIAETGAEHDADNDRQVEHRQRVNKAEREKAGDANNDADVHDALRPDALDDIAFERTENSRLDARQRECAGNRRPAPAELALEGRKERAHAEVTKSGIPCVGKPAGDDEPPF